MSDVTSGEKTCWFVMRDLGRTSLDKSYYKLFKDNGFEAYTPLKGAGAGDPRFAFRA